MLKQHLWRNTSSSYLFSLQIHLGGPRTIIIQGWQMACNVRGFFCNQATRVQEEQCGHYFQEYFKFLTLPSQFFSSWQVSFALVADLKMWWYFLDIKILTFLIFLYFWDILIILDKWASLYVALINHLRRSLNTNTIPLLCILHSFFETLGTESKILQIHKVWSFKQKIGNWLKTSTCTLL